MTYESLEEIEVDGKTYSILAQCQGWMLVRDMDGMEQYVGPKDADPADCPVTELMERRGER